jgi:hypothetical protein
MVPLPSIQRFGSMFSFRSSPCTERSRAQDATRQASRAARGHRESIRPDQCHSAVMVEPLFEPALCQVRHWLATTSRSSSWSRRRGNGSRSTVHPGTVWSVRNAKQARCAVSRHESVETGEEILQCPDLVVVRLPSAEHNLLSAWMDSWAFEPAIDRDAHLLRLASARRYSP